MKTKGVAAYCVKCRRYISLYTEVYLPDGSENPGRVCCLKDGQVVGYTWDEVWKKLFDND